MIAICPDLDGRGLPLSLCHFLLLCATCMQLAHARPQTGTHSDYNVSLTFESYTNTKYQVRMIMRHICLVVWI
jgi:hypothetical protein